MCQACSHDEASSVTAVVVSLPICQAVTRV
jgi:hypothetical protein